MRDNTDLAWERWGQQDPYFAVLTEQKYRRNCIEDTKVSFFESGRLHIREVMRDVEDHFGPIPRGSALDFGCGVGRLMVPLSKEFSSVTGLDVSRAMLAEASKNLSEGGIANVELLESDDDLSKLGNRKFDFVHTYIVLQHVSPRRGYVIVRNLLRHVSPGGAFFIHVSCRRNLPLSREVVYRIKTGFPWAYVAFNILQRKKMFEPVMEGNEYDVVELMQIFQEAGFEQFVTRLENRNDFTTASFYSKNGPNLS